MATRFQPRPGKLAEALEGDKVTSKTIHQSLILNLAAAARREAAKRQENAKVICIECHGPDGIHTSECNGGQPNGI